MDGSRETESSTFLLPYGDYLKKKKGREKRRNLPEKSGGKQTA
jgi:hypothetical protein